jgi:TRAP-type C4-dicarboxylate transport system permease small subunit
VKQRLERLLANLFGLCFLGLSFLVTVETLLRKVFNFSLQGAAELGGYALAVGSAIGFGLAAATSASTSSTSASRQPCRRS